MGIFSGYIYFLFIFFTKNIYLNYTDVGTGTCVGERGGGNTDVRARRASGSAEG